MPAILCYLIIGIIYFFITIKGSIDFAKKHSGDLLSSAPIFQNTFVVYALFFLTAVFYLISCILIWPKYVLSTFFNDSND